ncbi:MurR/RpiR family transcriptional regulator [Saccharopolyspora oryzae]|uniref:MurR/RpiR family transcriptional regulator n=1 Tax=Saccharopolyspora oryzae TaxID=2997343 RepID=A0ABT4URZ0_9PSEU|nr:MurR/RpiR family transcriptional regulator [Saccharopolyspora oryzae]MDA3624424.1 MurR/RpiR family transcriptional regulator [Saccharopolyspora oryzae]
MNDQPVGGTLARIRATLPALLPSEQRVAEVLLARPKEVVDWSVADLAAAASTSSATAVRACQHLGFRGFQQLRLLLARDIGAGAQQAEPEFSPEDPPEAVASAVFSAVSSAVSAGMSTIDADALARAADRMTAARRILFVGNGGSSFVAQAAAFRFAAAGFPADAPVDAVTQQITARLLAPEDLCVAVSSSGANELTVRAAEAAQKAGAGMIGVTGFARSPLASVSDIVLVTGTAPPVAEPNVLSGPMTQLALLVSLQITVGFRRADRSQEVLEEVWRIVSPDLRRS